MGVAHAIGEYILFVDSDDYLLPDGLSTLHQASLRFQDADFYPGAILSTVEWNNYKPGQNVSMC